MSEAVPVTAREGYRLWAASWDRDPSAVVALETRWLLSLLGAVRGKRVLDISCGTGRWSAWAHNQGARVLGTDLSSEMLARAAAKPGLAGRLSVADSTALPVASGCADVVLCALSLGHILPPEAVIAEAARATAPGGSVLVTDLHPDACRQGWKRTFRRDGRLYAIENHAYTKVALLKSAARAGLRLRTLMEPRFEEAERHFFVEAGKPWLFEEARRTPALLIAAWEKPA